jgi:hypothetical protein
MKPRWTLEITLFKLAQWVAVPAISEILLDPMVQEKRQQTLLTCGYRELWAVLLSDSYIDAYTVPVTLEGLEEFRRKIGAFDCALFTGEPEPDWVIIPIESELDVIAGPADFIRQLLDCEIDEAFSHFQNYAMHQPIKQLREYLQLVHDRLKNYQSAEVGTEFCLTP